MAASEKRIQLSRCKGRACAHHKTWHPAHQEEWPTYQKRTDTMKPIYSIVIRWQHTLLFTVKLFYQQVARWLGSLTNATSWISSEYWMFVFWSIKIGIPFFKWSAGYNHVKIWTTVAIAFSFRKSMSAWRNINLFSNSTANSTVKCNLNSYKNCE